MRILLVEDDVVVAASLSLMLKAENVNLVVADTAEEGQDMAELYDFDLIMLDVNLPDQDGVSLLRDIRMNKVDTPVLMLSGNDDSEIKVSALNAGADDYVTKPFNRNELVARMNAIVRRSRGHAQSIIQVEDLALDLAEKKVAVAGVPVDLTRKEYAILELLMLKKDKTVTKEMFLDHVYGGEIDPPEMKVIDVFVCKVRKKLASVTGRNYIQTVWGRGYAAGTDEQMPQFSRAAA